MAGPKNPAAIWTSSHFCSEAFMAAPKYAGLPFCFSRTVCRHSSFPLGE
jgi:hypothetical protein